MAKKKERIYMDRWLFYHPYRTPVPSDFYYLRLCNEAYSLMEDGAHPEFADLLAREEVENLACFIVCYFEDVISGAGLWRAFTAQVYELYGTYLPFYDLNPDDYYPDEINIEDISFLIWYFISMTHYDENTISPEILEWSDLSFRIFDVFDREYEQATENPKLKEYYKVGPGENSFFVLKDKMRWIMVDSWLLHFQRKELADLINEDSRFQNEDGESEENRKLYLYDIVDSYILSTCTTLLARQGKDWLAYIQGKDHPLFKEILGRSEKKSGYYFFMGMENENLLFQHIASEKVLKVSSMSMDVPEDLEPGKSISFAGFVRWKDEWWFSGTTASWGYDADLVSREQNSETSRMLFGEDPVLRKSKNEQLYASFLKFNDGKPIVFVESEEKAHIFVRDYLVFHNESLDIPASEKREGRERILKNELLLSPDRDAFHGDTGLVPGMIFFNRESGIQMAFGLNDLVPDPDNTSYRENSTVDVPESESDTGSGHEAMRLLYSSYISGDWMQYLVKNYDIPGLDFPGEGGRELLMDNLDFMMRFWKRKNYYP
jgi:hypothetical protein